MNFNKKNFAGQNFGQQRVAAENVAECATETVTTEVAEVANNKSAFVWQELDLAGMDTRNSLVAKRKLPRQQQPTPTSRRLSKQGTTVPMREVLNWASLLFFNLRTHMEKDNKISKKTLISIITIGGLGLTLGYVLKKNRELTGVIKNQQLTIDGLMKEVKNLSYHLGKKTIINK